LSSENHLSRRKPEYGAYDDRTMTIIVDKIDKIDRIIPNDPVCQCFFFLAMRRA